MPNKTLISYDDRGKVTEVKVPHDKDGSGKSPTAAPSMEAEAFYQRLIERFKKFGLELALEKTKILEFGRFAKQNRAKQGLGKPETFDFLGFTFYCSENGKKQFFRCKVKTSKNKFRSKVKAMK